MENRKKVFISYSWDGLEHQDWVLKLASDLIEKFGIDVILDQFELSAGKDLTHFMENAILVSDKVLIILTPNYKAKAENREKGVGYETSMISKEIFESSISTVKFIPILRQGNQNISSPKFLSSKLYHQMTDDSHYINKLYELSRIIYNKPVIEKPKLGPIPELENFEKLDPIIDIANSIISKEKINQELDRIIDSHEGVELFEFEIETLTQQLKEKVDFYSLNSALRFGFEENRRACVVGTNDYSVFITWENIYTNSARNSELSIHFFKGAIRLNNPYYYYYEPKQLKVETYKMELDYSKKFIWKFKSVEKTTTQIQQDIFLFIVDKISEDKSKNFRH